MSCSCPLLEYIVCKRYSLWRILCPIPLPSSKHGLFCDRKWASVYCKWSLCLNQIDVGFLKLIHLQKGKVVFLDSLWWFCIVLFVLKGIDIKNLDWYTFRKKIPAFGEANGGFEIWLGFGQCLILEDQFFLEWSCKSLIGYFFYRDGWAWSRYCVH